MERPDRRDKAAMGRWFGVPASNPAAGTEPGVKLLKGTDTEMTKASADGIYTTVDEQGITHRFKVAKGDTIPDGAEFTAGEADQTDQAKPAEKKAVTGPSDTTAATGPSATTANAAPVTASAPPATTKPS